MKRSQSACQIRRRGILPDIENHHAQALGANGRSKSRGRVNTCSLLTEIRRNELNEALRKEGHKKHARAQTSHSHRRGAEGVRRRPFPKALDDRVRSIKIECDGVEDTMRRQLRKLRSEQSRNNAHGSGHKHKDYERHNKAQMLTAEERSMAITLQAARQNQRRKQAMERAVAHNCTARELLESQIALKSEARASKAAEKIQQAWLPKIVLVSSLAIMGEALESTRYLTNLSMRQAVAVLCVQRRWRIYSCTKAMRRRIAARKIIIRAVSNWVRRLRLKWRRAHTCVLLNFLKDSQRIQSTFKHSVTRYRHLVITIQRRWRAYQTMWRERSVIAKLQFRQVAAVMVQPTRVVHFRRDLAMRKLARTTNDALAEAGVRTIPRVSQISSILLSN